MTRTLRIYGSFQKALWCQLRPPSSGSCASRSTGTGALYERFASLFLCFLFC